MGRGSMESERRADTPTLQQSLELPTGVFHVGRWLISDTKARLSVRKLSTGDHMCMDDSGTCQEDFVRLLTIASQER